MNERKILLVEDDQDLRLGLSVRLGSNGYATVFAADGAAALAAAQRERPDLILLDLGLPNGDGFSVLERLRSIPRLADIPVIVLTAREAAGNEARAEALGVRAFFQKPVVNDMLLGAIRAAIDGTADDPRR